MSKFEKASKLFVDFIDWESESIAQEVAKQGHAEKDKSFRSSDNMDYLDKLIKKLPSKV